METVWFDDPMNLFAGDKLLKFWPLASQTPEERVNATTRFIIYISLALFIIKKDVRIFVLAAVAVGVLYAFYKSEMITTAVNPAQADGRKNPGFMRPVYQKPNYDNPMGNVLMSDYTEQPDRPGAAFYPNVRGQVRKFLDDSFPQDVADVYGRRNQAASRFYSMPVTTSPATRPVLRRPVMVQSSNQCARAIRPCVTQMPVVFSSRPLLVSMPMVPELVCAVVAAHLSDRDFFSQCIINGEKSLHTSGGLKAR